ncbi:MAG: exopolysaccharide biosynthesis protein [Pseudomonadota bacterium]
MRQPRQHRDDPDRSFVNLVAGMARAADDDGLTIGQILDRLDERAFGIMILILAIPCLVPALYGVPQIVGVPIILLAGQMLIGRKEPWLPASWTRRHISKEWLNRMADFADKRMRWVESLSKPRLQLLSTGFGERMAALLMILATLTIILPMTNSVPSLGLALMAAGLIQRDGLFVLAGGLVALAWVTALIVVAVGLAFGASWAISLFERVGGDALLAWFGNLFGG